MIEKTKSILTIIREALVIITLGITLYKGTNLANIQQELAVDKKTETKLRIKNEYIKQLKNAREEYKYADNYLKTHTPPLQGSTSWGSMEAVRARQKKEVLKLEKILDNL